MPPGPRTPRLAQAVLWGAWFPSFSERLRARYGDTFTVKLGTMPPLVVTSDHEAIRHLLTGDPLRRRHGNEVLTPMVTDRSVILLEPEEHLERRRLLLPAFHGERVRAYGSVMQELVDEELDRWRPGDVVSVFPVMQALTLELIMRAVLGISDEGVRTRLRDLIDDALYYPWGPLKRRIARDPRAADARMPEAVRRGLTTASVIVSPAVSTFFPGIKRDAWWNVAVAGWWPIRAALAEVLDEQIAATRADPRLGEREDVLATLVRDGEPLPDLDLREELITLVTAGHETTAMAISWGCELLAHNPGAQGDPDNAAYLDALAKEVLRMRPPVPLAAVRVLDEPMRIGSYTVPAGLHIGIDVYGVHGDPARYEDPEAFRPGRFLEGSPPSYAFLPFGGGAHRCIGAPLAELEIRVALGTILRRVDFEPLMPELARTARRGVLLLPDGGGRIRVRGVRPAATAQAPGFATMSAMTSTSTASSIRE
jgi:cytochrome P450 family 135